MKKRNTGKKIAKYVVIAIILFVLLFPVYWMINCSLEWLYRLIKEPWRFRRMLRLPKFVWKVILKRISG